MRKLILLVCAVISCAPLAWSQSDAHFSQFVNSPLELNPANAGLFQGKFRGVLNYRRQWENIGNAFQTIGASGDFQVARNVFDRDFFGVGVNILQDQAGVSEWTNLNANLHISYTKIMDPRDRHYVSLGFMTGFAQRSFALTSLRWNNQWTLEGFNTDLPNGEFNVGESATYLDLAGGVNYFYSNDRETFKAYGGIAAFHLNQPDISLISGEDQLYTRYVINGGTQFFTGDESVSFFPNAVFMFQGPNNMLNFGGDVRFYLSRGTRMTGFLQESSIALGMYHRWGDAFIPTVKLNAGGFQLGISYDLTIGELSRSNDGLGGPEFSLIYRVGYKSGLKRGASNTRLL